jgi:Protein kinase domain/HEAT repeats
MNCPSCQAEYRFGAKGCRRCHRALPTLVPGDVVAGRFEILSLLGTGGMGVVFKVTDRTLDEVVALKTLRMDPAGVGEMATRFRSETRLARKVSSRHVCRIHEYGIDGELHYFSMEYVDGVTIKDLLQVSGGLPTDAALDIADQVLAGLTAIHDAGIMHRDVKPSNLMRTRAGLVKLMDFGIAKQVGGVTLTAAGQAVGTPEYMSPEQVMGHKLDLRTDVYTAGVVIFELLTGVSPFRGATTLETAHKLVTQPPDFELPGIPSTLVPVLRRALSKDKNQRFASARELSQVLALVRPQIALPSVRTAEGGSSRTTAAGPGAPLPLPAAAPAPARRVSTAESQAMMPPPVAAVLNLLRGPDPIARRQAVLSLAELGPRSQTAVRALADALRDPDGRVRFMAAAALGRIGPAAEAAAPALLRALDDESAGNEAAQSLFRIGTAAVPALLEVMRSGQGALYSHAAQTLTRIGAGVPPDPRSS